MFQRLTGRRGVRQRRAELRFASRQPLGGSGSRRCLILSGLRELLFERLTGRRGVRQRGAELRFASRQPLGGSGSLRRLIFSGLRELLFERLRAVAASDSAAPSSASRA